jgi:hypothetical protein
MLVYHVEVGESCPGPPVHRTGFHRLDPQVVGEHEGKYGNTLKWQTLKIMITRVYLTFELYGYIR